MGDIKKKILESNSAYAGEFGIKSDLPGRPVKKVAILTCMDSRLDPAGFTGMDTGDAHIIRNAGGRASEDAIRSLVISHKMLGTDIWFVIHHTECGMETFDNKTMSELLSDNLDQAVIDHDHWVNVEHGGGSDEGSKIDWMTISDRKQSVIDDVLKIRNHPLVSDAVTVYGFLYDVKTGELEEVPCAE